MNALTIEAVRPKDLSERDIVGIHEVMQDMWASEVGLGELSECRDCGKMVSKEEAFRHLPPEISTDTVAHVFRILGTDQVPCPDCGGRTRLIYGDSNVDKIRDRLTRSEDAFVVLAKHAEKGIVGFEEGYVDSLERIFELDLTDHYGNVGLPAIRDRISSVLGYDPERMLLLSSLGLLAPYRNFQNMFAILARFSEMLPESRTDVPGLTEMHRGGVTYRMSEGIGQGLVLGIEDEPEFRAKMTSVGEKYESNLVAYANPVSMYRENFTKGMRHFLRSTRAPRPTQAGREVVAVC